MQYRRLGEAGIKLSEIGLGGWLTFGNALEQDQATALIDKAFDVGINFFDTADVYANGACERAWGQLLQSRRRADYVLATKAFFPMSEIVNDRGLSRKHLAESVHASLKRLRTDYLDIYQCHRHDPETPLEETISTMNDLVRQGKVLYWGFSEWPAAVIEQALRVCGDRFERPRSSQPRYSALERDIEKEVIPLCDKAGIGQIVFSPLAQGVLTGKYKPGEPPAAGTRAADDRQNQFIKRFTQNPDLLARVQRLVPVAREAGCSMAQLALAWVLRKREITSCIIGATRPQQIEDNAKASGLKVSESALRRVDELLQ